MKQPDLEFPSANLSLALSSARRTMARSWVAWVLCLSFTQMSFECVLGLQPVEMGPAWEGIRVVQLPADSVLPIADYG